jgi:hypothetical protein
MCNVHPSRGKVATNIRRVQALSDVSQSKEEAEKEARRLGALPMEVELIHVRSAPTALRATASAASGVQRKTEGGYVWWLGAGLERVSARACARVCARAFVR